MEIREIRTERRVRHVEMRDKRDKAGKGKIRCENKSSHDTFPVLPVQVL